ncbi:iron-sulfur assembly protein 1 [Holospora elegans E1]|uniref:Iron-sulfur assembly protein 1 n=1 Tax=Holospora elegans E1 TaxID=1427503 RepID=A0A023DX66_9PROT|nr:iron-sulfur cluster assembly accessory protein [Holospora elegans]GAJ45931.1 iron-sulfur assembly protein 1 [Holospora elegans E1]
MKDKNNQDILTVTAKAEASLRAIIQKHNGASVRLSLKRKGCAALSYMMSCVTDPCDVDVQVKVSGDVTLYIQSNALMFIIGLTMDYVEDGVRSGFVFHNPKEKGRCGCGSSFYV